jgi:hypothetical protein
MVGISQKLGIRGIRHFGLIHEERVHLHRVCGLFRKIAWSVVSAHRKRAAGYLHKIGFNRVCFSGRTRGGIVAGAASCGLGFKEEKSSSSAH